MNDRNLSRRLPSARHIYVLRFWQVSGGNSWRCQLHDITKDETLAFTDSNTLLAYLHSEIGFEESLIQKSGLR
jgi:hypothetical protein